MRIVGGKWRGRPLQAPPTPNTRPILDRVKTSIFDWLGARLAMPGTLPPIGVLDMFAGSGSFGLEAISRGAAHCCFIENASPALRSLRFNIDRLQCSSSVSVLHVDALRWKPGCPWEGTYQLCLLDPPYRYVREGAKRIALDRLICRLVSSDVVGTGMWLLFRAEDDVDWSPPTEQLELVDRRTYARMAVHLMRVNSAIGGTQHHATNHTP